MNSEEITKIIDEHSTFSFEMEVSSILSKSVMDTAHGGTYVDPVTHRHRQFDFQAAIRSDGERSIRFSIEVKKITTPLIIERVPRTRAESFHSLLRPCGNSHRTKRISPSSIYPYDKHVGKSANQIIRKGREPNQKTSLSDAEIYDKWAQAIASADGLVFFHREQKHTEQVFIMPILVVPDEMLYTIDYDASGNRETEATKVDLVDYYLGEATIKRDHNHPYAISHLRFLTLSGLERMVNDLPSEELENAFHEI